MADAPSPWRPAECEGRGSLLYPKQADRKSGWPATFAAAPRTALPGRARAAPDAGLGRPRPSAWRISKSPPDRWRQIRAPAEHSRAQQSRQGPVGLGYDGPGCQPACSQPWGPQSHRGDRVGSLAASRRRGLRPPRGPLGETGRDGLPWRRPPHSVDWPRTRRPAGQPSPRRTARAASACGQSASLDEACRSTSHLASARPSRRRSSRQRGYLFHCHPPAVFPLSEILGPSGSRLDRVGRHAGPGPQPTGRHTCRAGRGGAVLNGCGLGPGRPARNPFASPGRLLSRALKRLVRVFSGRLFI